MVGVCRRRGSGVAFEAPVELAGRPARRWGDDAVHVAVRRRARHIRRGCRQCRSRTHRAPRAPVNEAAAGHSEHGQGAIEQDGLQLRGAEPRGELGRLDDGAVGQLAQVAEAEVAEQHREQGLLVAGQRPGWWPSGRPSPTRAAARRSAGVRVTPRRWSASRCWRSSTLSSVVNEGTADWGQGCRAPRRLCPPIVAEAQSHRGRVHRPVLDPHPGRGRLAGTSTRQRVWAGGEPQPGATLRRASTRRGRTARLAAVGWRGRAGRDGPTTARRGRWRPPWRVVAPVLRRARRSVYGGARRRAVGVSGQAGRRAS